MKSVSKEEQIRRDIKRAKKRHSAKKRREAFITLLLTIFAVISAAAFIMPTVLTAVNSFMSKTEINADYGAVFSSIMPGSRTYISKTINLKFIPDSVSFDQYKTVLFLSPDYIFKFWNSMILTVPVVVFQTAVALLASYGFARMKGKFKNAIFLVYVFLMLMPYQVTMVPNYLVTDKLGLLNTRWAVILPGVFSPFAVFLLTKVMKRVPSAFYEAAMLDGANELSVFLHVYLPVCRSAIFSVMMLIFIDYWNMVEQPLILLSDSALHPLSVFLSRINSEETGIAFAVAVIYMIPALLMFLYGEDYLVEGITYSGGVKG